MTPAQKLSAGRYVAAAKVPYMASCLMSLVPRPDDSAPTLGVTARAIMYYNPKFIEKMTIAQVGGLLVHECFHLILEHHSRFKDCKHPDVGNMAQDMSFNPAVLKTGLELPQGEHKCLFPADFKLPDGKTADWYYDELMKNHVKFVNPHVAAGGCGGCAANPQPGEKDDSADADGRSAADMNGVRRQVAADIAAMGGRNPGTVPAELARWAEQFLSPPKVRWQEKLARRARSAISSCRAGLSDYSWSRPCRRTLSTWKPGEALLPDMDAPEPRCAVAFDTSGSMSEVELGIGIREARGILVAAGQRVEVLSCDAKLHRVASVRSVKDIPKLLVGGGGTDFNPIFEELCRPGRREGRPDVLVFLTDGYGPAPKVAPRGMHVIWLLTPGGRAPATWGETIQMEAT